MFVKKAVNFVETPYVPVNSFSDFPLHETVKKNILARGFNKPTAIQDKAMFPVLEGRDLVGIANTGTGKTAVFLLSLITKVSKDRNQKVLIVTPTRELAVQIQSEFKLFSLGMRIFSTLCIGGTSMRTQRYELSRQPNFVIGTPGRIKDLEKRRVLNLSQYGNVVLDEVDRMLDMGFIHDVRHIISFLPKIRQSLFFSATVPKETKVVMQDFLVDPIIVSVKTGSTPQNVDQDIIRTQGRNKLEILHQLLIKEEFRKVLVFGRTKWGVNRLEANLTKRGFKTVAIHGNKSQGQRLRAMKMLKNNEVQILLATDVASRGLDIEDLTHVINYDVPGTYDDYVHRIGRTGRAGKKGVALTFVD
ncbi:DEAD/DEAH box helicase [Candidatus Microgenomates bacterium]|nr:DEAD/DEAH box helicase [Candidatus Microgenomates bacterium]